MIYDGEKAASIFPLDYFGNIVRAVDGCDKVSIGLGDNYPIKLSFDMNDGSLIGSYIIAPSVSRRSDGHADAVVQLQEG